MQTYKVELSSNASKSFRCVLAAQSLDIDVEKKLTHKLEISADLQNDFKIGLIIGASGSGKTTLAKKIFDQQFNEIIIDENKTVLDQFPESLNYDECANLLNSIGLSSVTCWIRPFNTLSNGQKERAKAAIALSKNDFVVIDEWTSVVDRTVAKAMSSCVSRFSKKLNKKLVLISCHYDVIDWIDPDWIIDCNEQKFIDRRLLRQEERERKEKLKFEIRECSKSNWNQFSKYHYLNEKLPGGKNFFYGLFHDQNQIGFMCFSNYVPIKKNTQPIFHANRIVIHPDFVGFGLGSKFLTQTAQFIKNKGIRVMIKMSSIPLYKSLLKNNSWKFLGSDFMTSKPSGNMSRKSGFRNKVRFYKFLYIK